MVLEKPILPFLEWLAINAGPFLAVLLISGLAGTFLGFLAAALRHGPLEAARMTVRTLGTGLVELVQLSPRRLLAIARLAFQEAIRRRVLVVFILFVVALLFAGWFLDRRSRHPGPLYLSFVLTATNYLVMVLAIFLSAFSLPNDVKNKTIYTVVTKPVRGWEIVVGRMLGFIGIGTLLLALMCLFSYFFVQRGLQHTHELTAADLKEVPVEEGVGDATAMVRRGETSNRRYHRHEVETRADGTVVAVPTHDHTHEVKALGDGTYEVGPARGQLQARVPVRGELWFLDRNGSPSLQIDKTTGQPVGRGVGVNVGNEWKYRSYIEGGTLAAAVWRFKGLRAEDYRQDTLPLEMTIRVFRTYKGIIDKGLTGTIQLVKPAPFGRFGVPDPAKGLDGGLRSVELSFTAQDYEVYRPRIPRMIEARDASGSLRQVDVFKDLVDPETGELEVWVRCLDKAQYFGMAPADLYLLALNRPFWLNFIKGYISIWFQMVVVTCFGVAYSTFLSGSVAMIATAASLVMGFFKGFVFDVATGAMPGGGPMESMVRLVRQWNQMAELEPGIGTTIVKQIDSVLMLFVQGISYLMPDCGQFNTSGFVAYGFDIPPDLMLQHLMTTLAYALVVSAAGYFFFKTREVAA